MKLNEMESVHVCMYMSDRIISKAKILDRKKGDGLQYQMVNGGKRNENKVLNLGTILNYGTKLRVRQRWATR